MANKTDREKQLNACAKRDQFMFANKVMAPDSIQGNIQEIIDGIDALAPTNAERFALVARLLTQVQTHQAIKLLTIYGYQVMAKVRAGKTQTKEGSIARGLAILMQAYPQRPLGEGALELLHQFTLDCERAAAGKRVALPPAAQKPVRAVPSYNKWSRTAAPLGLSA